MKILYVITKSNWGGAQRHVFDLATSMKDSGHEVWVALGGEGLLKQKLEAAGIYVFTISSLERDVSTKKDLASFKSIFSLIREKRPDILHLHSPKAAGIGSLAGRLLKTKKIYITVHGWTFNESRPFWQKIAIIFFSWLTSMLSHKTILVSEKDYGQGLKLPFIKNRLVLIPLGIKPPVFYSIDGAKQMLAKMTDTDFSKKLIIGTIAELHPNKGLGYLIDAIDRVHEQYPNIVCILISDGQDRAKLEAQTREKNLSDIVKFTGYVDKASEYLKAFNIFVLPSIKEGLPYVLIESGFASLAVITTTVGGIPEIVEDMRSGILIQPKSSRELVHAISFMIEHPEERRRFGSALRDSVTKKFSFEQMIDKVLAEYGI